MVSAALDFMVILSSTTLPSLLLPSSPFIIGLFDVGAIIGDLPETGTTLSVQFAAVFQLVL